MKRMTEKIIKTLVRLKEEGYKINEQKIMEVVFLMHGKILVDGVKQELLDRSLITKEELEEKNT